MAQGVNRDVGHFDLLSEIAPRLAVIPRRGQGTIQSGEQQGVVGQFSEAECNASFHMFFPSLPEIVRQDIRQGNVAAPSFGLGSFDDDAIYPCFRNASRTS